MGVSTDPARPLPETAGGRPRVCPGQEGGTGPVRFKSLIRDFFFISLTKNFFLGLKKCLFHATVKIGWIGKKDIWVIIFLKIFCFSHVLCWELEGRTKGSKLQDMTDHCMTDFCI